MSHFQPQIPLQNEEGYLSDGSWCSDFDDFSETSEVVNTPSTEDYSKEIKDNKINEDIEAKLYANTPPLQCIPSKDSSDSGSVATSEFLKEASERKFGAIPKTAFSYISNELNHNLKQKISKKDNTPSPKQLEDQSMKFHSGNTPPAPMKPLIAPFKKLVPKDTNQNEQVRERCEINETPTSVKPAQKTPSKLKPEAFSFLSKVIVSQPPYLKESNTTNFRPEKKENHLVTTSEQEKKHPETPISYLESDKYESIVPEPTISLYDLEENVTRPVDNILAPTAIAHANKCVPIAQIQDDDIAKPPLPDRPPPVLNYPLGIFSQQASGTPKTQKPEKHNITLPITAAQKIPSVSKYSPGTPTEPTVTFEVKQATTVQQMQNLQKRHSVLSEIPGDIDIKSKQKMDNIKNPRKTSLPNEINLPNLKNSMAERPLPPLPNSPIPKRNSKTNNIPETIMPERLPYTMAISPTLNVTPNCNQQQDNIFSGDMNTENAGSNNFNPIFSNDSSTSLLKRNVTDLTIEESVRSLQEAQNFEKQCKPDLKPKPHKRLDITSQQSNVCSKTFHSQHEISAALRARFQGESAMKPVNVAYEEPWNKNDLPDTIGHENNKGFSDISMAPNTQSVLISPTIMCPEEEHVPAIPMRNSPLRKMSDIEEIQQSMERPCLPQKLKTTQRSLSCTSLVQTVKDMGFSIWSNNDKIKRRSEGRSPMEFAPKPFVKETKHMERNKTQGILTVPMVDKETTSKGAFSQEGNICEDPVPEKHISCFPWYHHLTARDAQRRLLALGQDGTFLIRPSSNATANIQFTACVLYYGRVFNLHIRQKLGGQYALGKEKPGEKTFSTISDLIKYHQEVPIEIHPNKSSTSQEIIHVYLMVTPPK